MAEDENDQDDVSLERTSGSVFAALGYADPREAERENRLVTALADTIAACGLTQVRAAEIVRMDQPTLSKLLRGRTRSVSTDRLTEMLNALGRDVTIVVGALDGASEARGHTSVVLDA